MDENSECVTCGKPVNALTECDRCGRLVHLETDGVCGGWLFDSWHEVAIAGENVFWCQSCLHEVDGGQAVLDVERVEQSVLRCPLQELEFRHTSGVYVLGNVHTKPAWWSVGHQPTGRSSWDWYQGRGLKTVVTMIEQTYPEFYAWLIHCFERV